MEARGRKIQRETAVLVLVEQAQFQPCLPQKSSSRLVLLLHFHHEISYFLNVTCSFQSFHPTAADQQKQTVIETACHALAVRATASLDSLLLIVCPHALTVCARSLN